MTKSKSSKKSEAAEASDVVEEKKTELTDEPSGAEASDAESVETVESDDVHEDETPEVELKEPDLNEDESVAIEEAEIVESDSDSTGDETEAEAPTEETASVEPEPVEPKKEVIVQKTGFFQTLVAGVLAAGAGFIAAQYSSQSWPFEPGPVTDPLAVAQAAQEDAETAQQGVADLEARVSAAEIAVAERSDATPDLSAIEAQLAELSSATQSLQERIAALEERPVASGEAPQVDLSAVEGEIAGLQDEVARLIAEANVAEATAAAAAQAELARAALARVMANLQTGAPLTDALSDIEATGAASIPDILMQTAADGVPTLAMLQEGFDPVARDALAAARAGGPAEGAGVGDRLVSFLQARTGARSVEPREGDDPDAILSRVGASIATGNIGDALAEAEALPEVARAAMSDWLGQAETRRDALAAAEALSQELNSN